MPEPNWPSAADELIRHPQAPIRLAIINSPGNEMLAAEYLAGVVRAGRSRICAGERVR